MKRRNFIKKAGLAAAGITGIPYILPTGRLFAATGSRVVNHVVYVLFAGGIRNQESVGQQFLMNQNSSLPAGNVMNNMLTGAEPSSNLIHDPWTPVLNTPLMEQGTLFKEVLYKNGPTGHYNGHTVAMTGNYTETGLNLNINPDFPTIFEYYRKHSDPNESAMNAWWISEGLGPYPSLNYSQSTSYGAQYGANYLRPQSILGNAGQSQLGNAVSYQPDDVDRINRIKNILDNNFAQAGEQLPGIQNTPENREQIKNFLLQKIEDTANGNLDVATPGNNPNLLTGDLINISAAWQVMDEFTPELTVINTTNLDVCHDDFSAYLYFLHRADYGIGWLWNKIQSHPILADDTIMICMPEHGRNLDRNNIVDANGLGAYDHTGDDNSRRVFAMIVGPDDKVVQGQALGSPNNPVAESIDVVPTIAHILGFKDSVPAELMPGRVLDEALI
ncbi:MAG: hypothetical protein AB8H03_04905 [Saprospiraceae bacterium]